MGWGGCLAHFEVQAIHGLGVDPEFVLNSSHLLDKGHIVRQEFLHDNKVASKHLRRASFTGIGRRDGDRISGFAGAGWYKTRFLCVYYWSIKI